jgi:hypothetical protein
MRNYNGAVRRYAATKLPITSVAIIQTVDSSGDMRPFSHMQDEARMRFEFQSYFL